MNGDGKRKTECGDTLTGTMEAPSDLRSALGINRYRYEFGSEQFRVAAVDSSGNRLGTYRLQFERVHSAAIDGFEHGVFVGRTTASFELKDGTSVTMTTVTSPGGQTSSSSTSTLTRRSVVEGSNFEFEIWSRRSGPSSTTSLSLAVPLDQLPETSSLEHPVIGSDLEKFARFKIVEQGQKVGGSESRRMWLKKVGLSEVMDEYPSLKFLLAIDSDRTWFKRAVRAKLACAQSNGFPEISGIWRTQRQGLDPSSCVTVIAAGGGVIGGGATCIGGALPGCAAAGASAFAGGYHLGNCICYDPVTNKNTCHQCEPSECAQRCEEGCKGACLRPKSRCIDQKNSLGQKVSKCDCTCEILECAGDTTGDPHLRSFDGLGYDFQAAGEFVLAQSTSGPQRLVQIRQRPLEESSCGSVAVNTAVATRLQGRTVGIYARRTPPVVVEGTGYRTLKGHRGKPPASGITRRSNDTYVVSWKNGDALIVEWHEGFLDVSLRVEPTRQGDWQGLLGDDDGETANDIALKDGTSFSSPPIYFSELYSSFAEEWRVQPDNSLFDYRNGKTTEDYTNRSFPPSHITPKDLPEQKRSDAETKCRQAGVDEGPNLQECIVDFGCTGNSSFLQSHANANPADSQLNVDDSLLPGDCTVERHDGHEYAFCRNSRTWPKARTFCADRGMHLVTLADEAEEQWVLDEAYKHHEGNWAIGLNDQDEEGTFVWVDGTPLNYTNWRGGEPNNTGGEDCVEANKNGWNDVGCERSKWPFICESNP
jgi:hypothetical protein